MLTAEGPLPAGCRSYGFGIAAVRHAWALLQPARPSPCRQRQGCFKVSSADTQDPSMCATARSGGSNGKARSVAVACRFVAPVAAVLWRNLRPSNSIAAILNLAVA